MTDDQKQMLTEKLLEECWHELVRYKPGSIFKKCKKCGSGSDPENRTFLTWQDVGDVKKELKKKALWHGFWEYSLRIYREHNHGVVFGEHFAFWLFREVDENGKSHFCRLVAEFIDIMKESDGGVGDHGRAMGE